MSLFDTDLIKHSFNLSSYTIVEGADSSIYFEGSYGCLFKKEVYYKDGYFIGIRGVIDMIGKIPIDYLHEYKNGNIRPILRFIKYYTTKHCSFHIEESQDKYTFIFATHGWEYWMCGIKCVINVYAR